MPLLWPSTRSARSAVAVVKNTVWPASTTARPRAIARCVLRRREEQSHTAQFQRSVVIHYCWHPFVGQQLTVKSIQRAPDGQRALRCLLPDGTWTFLPEWMTSREQCARLMLVDEPCVSVGALEALIGLLRSLPRAAAPARIEAEAMSKDKEARRDATTAIRPGSTGTGMDESYAVGGRARRHPRPRPRAPQRSPAAGHDSAPARRGIGR